MKCSRRIPLGRRQLIAVLKKKIPVASVSRLGKSESVVPESADPRWRTRLLTVLTLNIIAYQSVPKKRPPETTTPTIIRRNDLLTKTGLRRPFSPPLGPSARALGGFSML
jgi:hypothetical protein